MQDELHYIQMQILRELIFHPNAKFSDLNISGLTNDHFSYHISKLTELGLVTKSNGKYSLSANGKKYSGKMDTDNYQFEKQPKSGALIIPIRIVGTKKEFLIQQRTKEPYFGYWGFMTGKLRFGEKIYETANRELDEEMGVSGEYKLCFILHEMVYNKTGNQLEDKLFYIIEATNIKGTIKQQTEDGKNKWVTEKEFRKITPKFHNENQILDWYLSGNKDFKEETYFIESF